LSSRAPIKTYSCHAFKESCSKKEGTLKCGFSPIEHTP
jgi:hypothetical protein